MGAKLQIRPRVYRDLDEIAAYIQKQDPAAALRFIEAAEQTFQSLAKMPGLGSLFVVRKTDFEELRCFPVERFKNYLIFYDRHSDQIEVIRVLHGARRLAPILGKSQ